jgi:hypothetical protein
MLCCENSQPQGQTTNMQLDQNPPDQHFTYTSSDLLFESEPQSLHTSSNSYSACAIEPEHACASPFSVLKVAVHSVSQIECIHQQLFCVLRESAIQLSTLISWSAWRGGVVSGVA